jgi:uncharacterized protein YcfJ
VTCIVASSYPTLSVACWAVPDRSSVHNATPIRDVRRAGVQICDTDVPIRRATLRVGVRIGAAKVGEILDSLVSENLPTEGRVGMQSVGMDGMD